MNAGVFCRCNQPWVGTCLDGSACISIENSGDLGVCMPECSCDDYDLSCGVTTYSSIARCILASDLPIDASTRCHCILMNCETADDCPPHQECQEIISNQGPYEGVTITVCSP